MDKAVGKKEAMMKRMVGIIRMQRRDIIHFYKPENPNSYSHLPRNQLKCCINIANINTAGRLDQ